MNKQVKKNKILPFQFKQFSISQENCTMKVGTDGVLLGAWAAVDNCKNALDIGTGTGLIAIMLGQRNANATIDAVEIDELAYQEAVQNIENCPWTKRVTAFHQSIQDFSFTSTDKYDLIVSNPPFFSGGTFSLNQDRNDVRHTVKLPHGDLLQAVRRLLAQDGKFCVVLPFIEGLRFEEIAKNGGLYCTKMLEVKPKEDKPIERLLMQFERQEAICEKAQLVIQKEARNDWTADYVDLTGAFYLKM